MMNPGSSAASGARTAAVVVGAKIRLPSNGPESSSIEIPANDFNERVFVKRDPQ